jgi:coproporphyrinogen III oxidase-like Fe-S oxidoreductase
MMLGLRLVEEGVSARNFELRFKRSIDDVFGDKVDLLLGKGLIEWTGVNSEILRLSKRGRLLGNQVFVEFV